MKALAFILVLFNLIIFALAALYAQASWRSDTELMSRIANSGVESFQHLMDERLSRAELAMGFLSSEFDRMIAKEKGKTPQAFNELLREASERLGMSFRAIDSSGKLAYSPETQLPDVDYSDRPAYIEAKKSNTPEKIWMNPPAIGKVNKLPSLIFFKSIRNFKGEFAGAISVAIPLEKLHDLAIPKSAVQDAIYTLRDSRDGRLLMLSSGVGNLNQDPKDFPKNLPTPVEVAKAFAEGRQSGVVLSTSTFDGRKRIIAFRVSEIAPLSFGVGLPAYSTFAGLPANAAIALVFMFFSIGASGVFFRAMKISRTIVESRQKALIELNQSLDRQVDERTKDLSEAMELLRKTHGELLESERLASLGKLVDGVSHELNTPLGNSLLCASSIEQGIAKMAEEIEMGHVKT